MDTWQMIKKERVALVDTLGGLADEDWAQPSLCAGWTVRDTAAHIVATATMTPPAFLAKLAGSGFSFQQMTRREIARISAGGGGGADLVQQLRARIDSRSAPPGPAVSWLGETIVHGEDIRRALGGYGEHPVEHLLAVADFYKNSNLLIGTKRRIAGVTLRATDADWRHGTGPEASGRLVALVLAMTGRRAALADLTGEAVPVLHQRP
jgi:uncharacterized protein (TIGR03083 family)